MDFEILKELNEEQQDAVTSIDGYIRVIAGAGSGKTKALTHRYAFLVNECGIAPSGILCVTFTSKAAQEMKQRIRDMIGDIDVGYICTFHSLCVRILREDIHFLNYPSRFSIIDNDDQKELLKEVYDNLNLSEFSYPYSYAISKIREIKFNIEDEYVYDISRPEGFNYIKLPEKFDQTECDIFSEYLRLQRKNFALDFSDLLIFVEYLLKHYEIVCDKWSDRFEYIQVDEFQDVSNTEYELIQLLSSKHHNLFIVGDPDQTIYSWRGSEINHIIEFDKKFEDAKTISMVKNYRSGKNILLTSNSLISKNTKRLEKALVPGITNPDIDSCKMIHYHGKTQIDECKWIVNKIKELVNEGYSNDDISILYRSRYAVPALENALRKASVPYKICDGISFYNQKEIKIMLAYFNFIIKQDDIYFKKIINVPNRQIGVSRMRFLKKIAEEKNISLFNALRENIDNDIFEDTQAREFLDSMDYLIQNNNMLTVSDILDKTLKVTCYEQKIMYSNDDDELNVLAELKTQIAEIEKQRGETMNLQDYLDEVTFSYSENTSKEKPAINLMTIHSAKGLEFKVVFVCAMNEGTFPTSRTDTREKMEEERRLAYVALTRAQERLYLTDSEFVSEEQSSQKITSRFIQNIETDLFDHMGEYSEYYDQKKAAKQIFDSENKMDKCLSFDLNDEVEHQSWGKGIIEDIDINSDSYIINFNGEPIKIKRTEKMKFINKQKNDFSQTQQPLKVGDIVDHAIFGRGKIKYIDSNKQEYFVQFNKYETNRKISNPSKLTLVE